MVTLGSGVSPIKVKRWKVKILTRNISKTVTDTRFDPPEPLHVRPTGFQLAPSPLTFDDIEGSKIKVILFDVKYVKNGNSHGVGPIGFTLDDPERLKVKVTNGAVTAIGMWGYTPVGLTGVLVSSLISWRTVVFTCSTCFECILSWSSRCWWGWTCWRFNWFSPCWRSAFNTV